MKNIGDKIKILKVYFIFFFKRNIFGIKNRRTEKEENGAVGRTRTVMPFSIRPSNVRVYQFHHDRFFEDEIVS
jgi:hypothetical protein